MIPKRVSATIPKIGVDNIAGPGDGQTSVLVRTGVSALAVREAIGARPSDDYLTVLTDRSDADLGLGIRACRAPGRSR